MKLPHETMEPSKNDEERFLPPLPSVEQMQRDVANATCELQQAFFHPQNFKLACEQEAELRKANKQFFFHLN